MKVLHINALTSGGAANACFRLHHALMSAGVDSSVLTLKHTNIEGIKNASAINQSSILNSAGLFLKNRVLREIGKQWKNYWLEGMKYHKMKFHTPNSFFTQLASHPLVQEADIINLHWTAQLLDYPSFFGKLQKKIVWTLHDMNPFTGGCDYAFNCENFIDSCQDCWLIKGARDENLAEKSLTIKEKAIRNTGSELHIVALSNWMKELSEQSKLFRDLPHFLIPNSLDTTIFKPYNKEKSREELNLPLHQKIILFVSDSVDDKRKGFQLLLKAISEINDLNILPIAVGATADQPNEGIHFTGFIQDPTQLAKLYSAADAFVIPSLEDNLPNTILEAFACGCPVIGFNRGGISNMIKPDLGILAPNATAENLAQSIRHFFDVQESFVRHHIREYALQNYAPPVQAQKYISLYKEILSQE